MLIVNKNRRGDPFVTVDIVAADDTELLKKQWGIGYLSEVSIPRVVNLLEHIKSKGYWLACECVGLAETGTSPLLIPRRTQTGRITLARSADRGSHSPNCAFAWEEGVLRPRVSESRSRRPVEPSFMLYGGLAEKSTNVLAAPTSSSSSYIDSHLARCLLWLLNSAGCSTVRNTDEENLSADFEAIKVAAKNIYLHEGVSLADVLWFSEKAIFEGRALRRFMSMDIDAWPRNTPRQGFLIVLPKKIEGNCLQIRDQHIYVDGEVKYVQCHGERQGPYIGLISLKFDERKSRCQFANAVVTPRLIGGLTPIRGLRNFILVRALTWCSDKAKDSGIDLKVESMSWWPAKHGELVPSFVISTRGISLVICDTCVGQKASSDLCQIGAIVEVDAGEKDAVRGMTSKVMQWVRRLISETK